MCDFPSGQRPRRGGPQLDAGSSLPSAMVQRDGWVPTAGQLEASGRKCGVQLREGVILFLGLSPLSVAQSLI